MVEAALKNACVHFVGIGGIGMSGIAELMHRQGIRVQGSDLSANANVQRLRGLGIQISEGHDAANLGAADRVVMTSAAKPSNPELVAARDRGLPVIRRGDMLAQMMRGHRTVAVAGSHGKTTTTTLIAELLSGGGLDATVVNGGVMDLFGSNAHLGSSNLFVAESDESDGSFLAMPVTMAVVTNLDPEHLDHYGSFEKLQQAFDEFLSHVPADGYVALCRDHPLVARMADGLTVSHNTFGFAKDADLRPVDLSARDGRVHFAIEFADQRIDDLSLPLPGKHNILNALGAIAIALRLGVGEDSIRRSLSNFKGVQRRFTLTGKPGGVAIIDDYAHHPVEIAAVLGAAREAYAGQVIAVLQPHRFTRLKSLFDEFARAFASADHVLVAPVYTAGEDPLPGINNNTLAARMTELGQKNVSAIPGPDALPEAVAAIAKSGDVVVCLGAGSISQWAHALPDQLTPLLAREAQA